MIKATVLFLSISEEKRCGLLFVWKYSIMRNKK